MSYSHEYKLFELTTPQIFLHKGNGIMGKMYIINDKRDRA